MSSRARELSPGRHSQCNPPRLNTHTKTSPSLPLSTTALDNTRIRDDTVNCELLSRDREEDSSADTDNRDVSSSHSRQNSQLARGYNHEQKKGPPLLPGPSFLLSTVILRKVLPKYYRSAPLAIDGHIAESADLVHRISTRQLPAMASKAMWEVDPETRSKVSFVRLQRGHS